MGSRVSACSWTGLASSGSPDRPARDTWYNGSTNCVVLVQEPGHNFGMKHSSSMKCGGVVFHDVPMGNCVHSEYGDPYDPMGRACRHMNSYQKAYEGWFGGCNVVDVTSTGTFTLLPIELACNGVQALQIPMPKARPFYRSGGGGTATTINLTHYYVEMRASQGFDRGLTPQVQIRVSGDIRLRTQGGINTWILDNNPATTAFEGLVAGGSFTDPEGTVKITVEAIDSTKATVRVDIEGGMGAPKCLDGTTLEAPGPGAESCAPAPVAAGSAPPMLPPLPDGGARGDVAVRPPLDVAPARPSDAGPLRDGPQARPADGGAPGNNEPGGSTGRADGGRADAELIMGAPGADGGAGPRAGGGGSPGGSGTAGAAGAAGSGSGPAGGSDKLEDAGCGCRVGGRPGGPAVAPVALALLAACGVGARRLGRRGRRGASA
jgi:hypothetical protein